MSLKRINISVLDDAKKEAEKILKEAKELLRKRVLKKKNEIMNNLEERYKTISDKQEKERDGHLTEQRTKHKMELLKMKNRILEEIFTKAAEKFVSDKCYWPVMEKWLKAVNEPGSIYVNARDLKRFKVEFLDKTTNKDIWVLETKSIDITGGFILKTEKFEIDNSLDTILINLKQELTPSIAERLFGK